MKVYLLFCMFLFPFTSFSQVVGMWKIVKYRPEIELDRQELREMKNNVIGKTVNIDSHCIVYPRNKLVGVLNKIQKIKVIDRSEVPDSLQDLVRYFCQEVYNLGAVTKQTLALLDPSYKRNTLQVCTFKCNEDKVMDCVQIYLLAKGKCGLAIPGDGLYLIEKIHATRG